MIRNIRKLIFTLDINYHSIISVIHHFISNSEQYLGSRLSAKPKQRAYQNAWEFINYFRRYMHDTQYNGNSLWIDLEKRIYREYGSGFGLMTVQKVCHQYDKKTGQYTMAKKSLSCWIRQLYLNYIPKSNHHIVYQLPHSED